MDVSGKRVVITGASAGIGSACAQTFAEAGCHLALVARRQERLEKLAQDLGKVADVEVVVADLDVRDRLAVNAWATNLLDNFGVPDILVNNAGLARGIEPLQEGDHEDWEEMIDTNVKGLLYVTRALLPAMVERGAGHVINIGSIAGHEFYPGGNVYCGTKHFVAALNRTMGVDLLGTGVRVSSVDPGMVETEFSLVRFHGDRERADGVYRGFEPLRGEDVADAVLFCATRPAHANVREMILMPSAQASAVHVSRRES